MLPWRKANTHPVSSCKQSAIILLLCGDKNPLMWASEGLLTALGLFHLCICLPSCPLPFLGVPWKGKNAFNDLHLTRLEIKLLVNLSHSMWNNRNGGDVTFLVGEHIKGACLQWSPRTSKGISGCQVSLDLTGEKERGRRHEEAHWILHTKGRYFDSLLLQSYALHYAWLFKFVDRKGKDRIKDKEYYFWLPSPQMQKYMNMWLQAPTHSTLIFLPAVFRMMVFSIFCWEGKRLQHFFRCQEAF